MLTVYEAEELDKPDIRDLLDYLMSLSNKFGNCKILCDSSSPSVWQSLCRLNNESIDYHENTKYLLSDGYKLDYVYRKYTVHPINFGTMHKMLLEHLKAILDDEVIRINPRFEKLITSLRSAVADEYSLDKTAGSGSEFTHVLDALRMATFFWSWSYNPNKSRSENVSSSSNNNARKQQQQGQQQQRPIIKYS